MSLVDGDLLVAQALQFFIAGYETTSNAISFILYELAIHQIVQGKLRTEVHTLLQKHGDITHECVKDMKYMEMCIKGIDILN